MLIKHFNMYLFFRFFESVEQLKKSKGAHRVISYISFYFIFFLIIHEFQDRKREFRWRGNDKFVRRCQGGKDGKKESKSRLTCFFFKGQPS